MGTRSDMGRGRRNKRGLASFISFLLLFAFALGQGSFLFALADTDPVATEDVVADGTMPAEEAPAEEAPAEEAPAEEAPAEEAPAEEAPAEEAPAEESASTSKGHPRNSLAGDPVGGGDASVAVEEEPTPGSPSTTLGVQPEYVAGNPTCATLLPDEDFLFERKIEPVQDSNNVALSFGGLTGSLDVDVTGDTFDFDVSGDFRAIAIFVKGGPNGNFYDYRPGGADAPLNVLGDAGLGDTGLHAPLNGDKFFGLSHISFCFAARVSHPGILVEKGCPGLVAFGENVTFTITVTNTGNEPLTDVVVNDDLLGGDITAAFDLPDPLPVGTTGYSADFTYTPGAGEDPVENSVQVSAIGTDSEAEATSSDVCQTDISNPAIQIIKTVSDEIVPVGTTVTYSFEVTNIGDVTLYDVVVTDDIMGFIGEIAILEVDESVTLTKDFVVGDEPVLNVATARGHDILGRFVSDIDDAFVTPIAGENPSNPPNPPGTPFTGSDAGRLGLITIVLFGIGAAVIASTRRRRSEREAA